MPVVLLFGPAGGGKTTTLQIVQNITEKLHTAYVDVAARGFHSNIEIITDLTAQLSLARQGLGTLRFPRFLLGQLALQLHAPDNSTLPSKQQVRDLLASLKAHRMPADIRDLVSKATDLGVNSAGMAVPGGTTDTLMAAVEVAFSRWRTSGEKWWAAAGRPTPDALLELHRMHHNGVSHERQQAQDKLMQAFLADLRSSYADSVWRSQGDVASPVLLDNVHTDAGQRFLDLLVRARNQHPDLVDPLLVVGTTGRSLRDVARPGSAGSMPSLAPLNYAAWRERWTPDEASTWYFPIWLRDLSEDDSARWARQHGIYDRWTVAAVHRLTGGHRLGTVELLTTGTERAGADVGRPRIRTLGVPRSDGGTLADALLRQLLVDVPTEYHDLLITCSACRSPTPTEIQAAVGNASIHAADDLRLLLDQRLWLEPGAPSSVHPFLRRLLHLHLQSRPDDHPDNWVAVHDRLRLYCFEAEDTIGSFHHLLALHEVREVVDHLEQTLDGDGDWLSSLKQITAAPNRLAKTGDIHPRTVVPWASEAERRVRTVALLVAGLWIQSDPLTASQPRLLRNTAHQFTELASLVPRLSDTLFTMAEECRREANTYDL
ncbi:hypothetical protein [Micromonospora sp. LOL_023]|uniref:hypothetical protein n=1 Tax=Micromonospora sp. LOL_023 TaxID=3345418 RepID=UPI003A8553FB